MYSKMAIKNVEKSFKDYTIYFLTLTLAVCIFYSFNSIESQKALGEMSASSSLYLETIASLISYISVFVAFVLGSLILYANNFLIKKRNKELGIYMTLGMGKSKISKILISETIIVGIASLVSGLILGLLASQGLSILVSKLFELKVSEYDFVISISAITKTIAYFGIMFLLVMIFNTCIISKYKIIDLLTVGRKTQEIKFKNPFVYLIIFILCVISLATAYKMVLKVGLNSLERDFVISILLGIIGTVLFFYSLAGFALYLVKKSKKIYFKGLNIFVVKQISSKVNTNFISMSIICLMLFLTLGILSTGFSFKSALEAGLKGATPFDASALIFVNKDDKVKSIKESFNKIGIKFNKDDKVSYHDEYSNGVKISDIIGDKNNKNLGANVSYIKISEYNNIRKIENKDPINLLDNEVLITSNFSKVLPFIEKYMANNKTIKLDNKVYNIKNDKVIQENLKTEFMQINMMTIVVKDDFCNDIPVVSSNVNINFAQNNKNVSEEKFINLLKEYKSGDVDYDETGFVLGTTRTEIYEGNRGETTAILFIGIYLGIVFLISSMAVLALQQLSEASDSIDRYVSLKKLGASKKSISKTIFMQTLIYFSIPIGLAIVHAFVGIRVVNDFISMFNKPDIWGPSIMALGILMSVYVIYFYTTYKGYKRTVMNKI